MQKLVVALVMVIITSLTGCSSSKDSDSNGDNASPMAGTPNELVSRSADALPVDDGLDQVNADLLNIFGKADADPVALAANETVDSLIAKRGSSR